MILVGLLLILCGCFTYFLYQYKKIHYRFEAAGLNYLKGVPVFGNVWKSTFLKRHFIYDLEEIYKTFPNDKYVGFLDGMTPGILVRDIDLMKTIVIKDFVYFQNRKEFFPTRLDPLLGRNLLQLRDNEWKITRAKLTPAFTAARLRHMLPVMVNVSKNIIDSLKSHIYQDIELTEFMYRYSGDVVLAAAFGLDQEIAGKKDSIFFNVGSSIHLNTWRRMLIFISLQFPLLGKAFNNLTGIYLFPQENSDFFRKMVSKAIEYRKTHNLSIPDYMDVLKELSENMPIDDLAGQVMFSFMASFESASGLLRLCFHELALNPNIQERLYQEIKEHKMGVMTHESISSIRYLDCVLNETSRKWSAAVMMDRVCTKPYLLPPPREGGKPYYVNPGDIIINVVNAIHMDPQHHENPEVFDPERFSEDNKHKIKQLSFMPFGVGLRGCLAARFANIQLKVMIYYMILNFKLVKCKKTCDPIELQPDEMNMKAVGGTWLRLEPRTTINS